MYLMTTKYSLFVVIAPHMGLRDADEGHYASAISSRCLVPHKRASHFVTDAACRSLSGPANFLSRTNSLPRTIGVRVRCTRHATSLTRAILYKVMTFHPLRLSRHERVVGVELRANAENISYLRNLCATARGPIHP